MSLHFYPVKTKDLSELPSWQDDVRSVEEKEIVLVFTGRPWLAVITAAMAAVSQP